MSLNTRQALKILMESAQNYIHHHSLGKSTLHDGCGDELAEISGNVFNKLLQTDSVVCCAESPLFWSKGYFRYTEKGGRT